MATETTPTPDVTNLTMNMVTGEVKPDLWALLTSGLTGVGNAVAAKAIDEAGVARDAGVTDEQIARAADAPAKKPGLRGRALALWVITGNGAAQQAKAAKAAAKAKPETGVANRGVRAVEWPKPAKQVLADYLAARVTADADGPNRKQPFIDKNDVLRVHSDDWRAYLAEQKIDATKSEAAAPLRDAGLAVKSFPLPGEDRAFGFYTGPAPARTKSLPRRVTVRAARPARAFGKPTDAQRALLIDVLNALEGDDETLAVATGLLDELTAAS